MPAGNVVQTDRFPLPADQVAAADVLSRALQRPYLMDYHFQGVELVVEGHATIVPLEHFNKGDMLAVYRLCFPGEQASVADMRYQILTSVEAVMVFRLKEDILRIASGCYPDVRVCSADALLLERFAARQSMRPEAEEAEQRDAYVSIEGGRFFAAVFRRGKLLYAASQDADNDSDRTFLLLGIWKALELHPQKDALHLEGATKELKKTLAEYILNID